MARGKNVAGDRTEPGEAPHCPICGSIAEEGCIYGPDSGWTGLQWRAGEPGVWGNLVTGAGGGLGLGELGVLQGPYVRGLRCASCRRIVIEYSDREDGPGGDWIAEASDLESAGEWDRAIALYQKVLAEPKYRAHHPYARNGIEAIEHKKAKLNLAMSDEPGGAITERPDGP